MSIDPCIPTVWPEFSLTCRVGRSQYRFTVANPDRLSYGVVRAQLDGMEVDPAAIDVVDDGEEHEVHVLLGSTSAVAQAGEKGRASLMATRPRR
jgi:cellobiose phosphorylase